VDEKEIQIHVKTFFQSYYTKPEAEEVEEGEEPVEVPFVEPDFKTVVAFTNETTATPSDVIFSLLEVVTEESPEHRDAFLPKVMEYICQQTKWISRDLEKGIGKFVQNVSD